MPYRSRKLPAGGVTQAYLDRTPDEDKRGREGAVRVRRDLLLPKDREEAAEASPPDGRTAAAGGNGGVEACGVLPPSHWPDHGLGAALNAA